MAILAIDWDNTLVHYQSQQWTDGAQNFLRAALMKHKVFVHSARANSPLGVSHIEQMLRNAGFDIPVLAKPTADLYIDDLAAHFAGDWAPLYRHPALHR